MVNFKELRTPEIVDIYNKQAKKLGEKPVKRFSNRTTAIKRTTAIMAEAPPKTNGRPCRKRVRSREDAMG